MAVQDRRVRRTQQLLAKALIDLTLEKGYEAVTIRDITERADIGYATFFRHYHDKDDLLNDVINVVLNELIDLLCPGDIEPKTVGTLLFRYVQQHSQVIRVLLDSRQLYQRISEVGTQNVLNEHTPQANSVIPPEIAAYHIVTSSIALIQWWLDNQMPYPPERMGEIYYALITHPTSERAFA